MSGYLDGSLEAFECEGRYCVILYETDRKWHERYLIRKVMPSLDSRSIGWFVVATPDGDVYAEPLAPPNVLAIAILDDDRRLPVGLARRNVYRFEDGSVGQALTAPEIAHVRGAAQGEYANLQAEIGDPTARLGAVPAAPTTTAAVPAAQVVPVLSVAAGHTWVVAVAEGPRARGSLVPLAQVVSGHQAGSKEVVALVDGSVLFTELIPSHEVGTYCSPPNAAAAAPEKDLLGFTGGALHLGQADDARTLAVRYGADGKRRRELRDGVDRASESAWTDWPIKGPRTARWVAQYIVTNGGAPLSMHQAWKSNCKLQASDGGVLEHEAICKTLELAIEYDQLNVGELASVELMCRRLQMIQYRWRDRILGASSTGTIEDEKSFLHGNRSYPRKLVHLPKF